MSKLLDFTSYLLKKKTLNLEEVFVFIVPVEKSKIFSWTVPIIKLMNLLLVLLALNYQLFRLFSSTYLNLQCLQCSFSSVKLWNPYFICNTITLHRGGLAPVLASPTVPHRLWPVIHGHYHEGENSAAIVSNMKMVLADDTAAECPTCISKHTCLQSW